MFNSRGYHLSLLLGILGVAVLPCHNVDAFVGRHQSSQVARIIPTATTTQLGAGVPKLDKWKVLPNGGVMGTVSNHPSIDDGDVITTSPLANPETARGQAVVSTASGSRYKLMTPLEISTESDNSGGGGGGFFSGITPSAANGSMMMNGQTKIRSGPEWRDAVMKYKLTTTTIGLEDEYILAGKPVRSTSGKSFIWEGYRAGEDGLPTGDTPYCIKVSNNIDAVTREYENYRSLSFLGLARGRFVKCNEFFPVAGYDKRFRNQCALILEMGARDLKSYLNSKGCLEGKELRDACISAAQCVQALHSCGLVWTDLKTENFVVMPTGEVKGIDLESAIPVGDNPVDYSPEACPPEFAEAFLSGDGPYFNLETSYDVWSLGMMFLELSTGRGYFDGKNPAQITKLLRDADDETPVDISNVDCDERLKDLMKRCLRKDPKKRPNMAQVLLHPYFITSPLSLITNFS